MRSLALLAVAFALALPSDHSLAVEITCLSTYTEVDTARITNIIQSGRTPKPSTCRAALLNGPIVPGDALKFAQFLRRHHPFLNEVILTSFRRVSRRRNEDRPLGPERLDQNESSVRE